MIKWTIQKKINQHFSSFLLFTLFIARYAFSDPAFSDVCSRKLSNVLEETNSGDLNVIYNSQVVKPWMRVLNSQVKSSDKLTEVHQALENYGLTLKKGPRENYIVAHRKAASVPLTIVTGRVTSTNGKPLISGVVTVVGFEKEFSIDEHGCFLVPGLLEGDYELSVRDNHSSYSTSEKKLSIFSGRWISVHIEVSAVGAALHEELLVYGEADNFYFKRRLRASHPYRLTGEFIDRLPATNPSGALLQIPGVTSVKQNGVNRFLTVRGFGGTYNKVTWNKRTLPTSSLLFNGGGDSNTRAFDFSNIGLNAIGSVELNKVIDLSTTAGGIGAHVNLNTIRPLDASGGYEFDIKLKETADLESNELGAIEPGVEAKLRFLSESKKFGFALMLSNNTRRNNASGAYVSEWFTYRFDGTIPAFPNSTVIAEDVTISNSPDQGQLYSLPVDYRYFHAERYSKRDNIYVSSQFEPIPEFTATIDFWDAFQTNFENRSELSIWMDSYKSHLKFDDSSVATPVHYWEDRRELAPRDLGMALQQFNVRNRLRSRAVNINWQVSEVMNVELDVHRSSSLSIPGGAFGNWINIGIGANVVQAQGVNFDKKVPRLMISADTDMFDEKGGIKTESIGSSVRRVHKDEEDSTLDEENLNIDFKLNDKWGVKLGVNRLYSENHFLSTMEQAPFSGGWSISTPGDVPENYIQKLDYAELFGFEKEEEADPFFYSDFHGQALPYSVGIFGDAAKVGDYLSAAVNLNWETSSAKDINRKIVEKIRSGYIQLNYKGRLKTADIKTQLGGRYESTDLRSDSKISVPTKTLWLHDNDMVYLDYGPLQSYLRNRQYSNFLPRVSVEAKFNEDLRGGLFFHVSMARPKYQYLRTVAEIEGAPRPQCCTNGVSFLGFATGGEPELKPIESRNIDLSMTWSYSENSQMTFDLFAKSIQGYITQQADYEELYNLRDSSSGERSRRILESLQSQGREINISNVFSELQSVESGGGSIGREQEGVPGLLIEADNDLMVFEVLRPKNNERVDIRGLEFEYLTTFDWIGLSVQANYTWIWGAKEFDIERGIDELQFAIPEMSDTGGIHLAYDQGKFQAFASFSWRSKHLYEEAVSTVEPRFVAQRYQVDAKIQYQVGDYLDFSFEVKNLTGEDVRQYGRTKKQFLWYESLSPELVFSLGFQL